VTYKTRVTAFGHVPDADTAHQEVYRFVRHCKGEAAKRDFLDRWRDHVISVAGHQHGIEQPVNVDGAMLVIEAVERIKESL
jgi:hypothetical protein